MWRSGLFALVFVFLGAWPLQAAQFKYAVYTSGFEVLDMDTTMKAAPGRAYALDLDAGLHGWLNRLAPWSGKIHTDGTSDSPRLHRFANTWRGETETSTFTFSSKGYVSGERVKPDGKRDALPKDSALTDNAVDVFTTLYRAMLQVDKTGKCTGSWKAYDGRRSFMMQYKDMGEVAIKPSSYTVFSGTARKCQVELKPLAGKWSEKPRGWLSVQEQSRLKGELPMIYFAKVRKDLPPVPVRAEIKTRYGAAILHLTGVTD